MEDIYQGLLRPALEHSVEVRWMADGSPPGELIDHLGASASVEQRTDRYVRPRRDDLNVKLRHGVHLETKWRVWSQSYELGDQLRGCVEGWTKWSLPHRGLLNPCDPDLVAVRKLRWTVPVELGTTHVGHVEVAELEVADPSHPTWSVCVEVSCAKLPGADGSPDRAEAIIAVTNGLDALGQHLPIDDIRAARSLSYAAWLRSVGDPSPSS